MIQLEFELAVACYVILLVHVIGHQLEVLGCSTAGVVAGDGELGIGQHLPLDVETFGGEVVDIMCFVSSGVYS